MQSEFFTPRLSLSSLTLADDVFILELVNTPGWLRFIGDRNVHTVDDARGYINRINQNPAVKYWVVKRLDEQMPIGIITFIKRDYLDHPDIGFAFLPAYAKSGYAFEAASIVLDYVSSQHLSEQLLATTIADNTGSIRLLEKLGFSFNKKIEVGGQKLLIYRLSI